MQIPGPTQDSDEAGLLQGLIFCISNKLHVMLVVHGLPFEYGCSNGPYVRWLVTELFLHLFLEEY